MRIFSKDKTRMVDDAPTLVIAAYKVQIHEDGEHFYANRVGIFDSPADADSWIATGEPKPAKLSVQTTND